MPAIAQGANQIRIGDQIYDIRTGSFSDGIVLSGPSRSGLEAVRQALVEAGRFAPTRVTYPGMTATSTAMGHRSTGLPETRMGSRRVIPLFAAMEPITSASMQVGRVRVREECSVGTSKSCCGMMKAIAGTALACFAAIALTRLPPQPASSGHGR